MYSIFRDPNTGLWVVIDTATNKRLGRAELPSDAISLAISNNGMPASERDALLAQATSIEQQEAQQQQASNSSASAGDTVANNQAAKDDNASPTAPAPAQEVISGEGRIAARSDQSGTNAVPTPTQASGDVDVGTDAVTRSVTETQSINTNSTDAIDTTSTVVTAPINPGVGAADEDSGSVTSNARFSSSGTAGQTTNASIQNQNLRQSYVYLASEVTSTFKQGRFEQTLKGILYNQSASTSSTVSQLPTESDAARENAKFDRQAAASRAATSSQSRTPTIATPTKQPQAPTVPSSQTELPTDVTSAALYVAA